MLYLSPHPSPSQKKQFQISKPLVSHKNLKKKKRRVQGVQFPSTSGETTWFQRRACLLRLRSGPLRDPRLHQTVGLRKGNDDDAHRDWKSIRDEAQKIENSEYLEDHTS